MSLSVEDIPCNLGSFWIDSDKVFARESMANPNALRRNRKLSPFPSACCIAAKC